MRFVDYSQLGNLSELELRLSLSASQFFRLRSKQFDLLTWGDWKVSLTSAALSFFKISLLVSKALLTANGILAHSMLQAKYQEIIRCVKNLTCRGRGARCESPAMERLVMLAQEPYVEMLWRDMRVGVSRISTHYAQVRNIKDGVHSCLYMFKLLSRIGESALAVAELLLTLAAEADLKMDMDRLFRVDFLTDVEFKEDHPWIFQAAEAHRATQLCYLAMSPLLYSWEQMAAFRRGYMYVAISPWDSSCIIGFFVLDRDVLKPYSGQMRSTTVNILHIETTDEFRVCGVATRMLAWAKARASRAGFSEICVDRGEENRHIANSTPFWTKACFYHCPCSTQSNQYLLR